MVSLLLARTQEKNTSSFMLTSGFPFSAGKTKGSCNGSFHFPERKAPLLSACVLQGNIQQHIFTWTVI